MIFISFLLSFLTFPLVYKTDQAKIDSAIDVLNKKSSILNSAKNNTSIFIITLPFYPPKFLSKHDSINLHSINNSLSLLNKNIADLAQNLKDKKHNNLHILNDTFKIQEEDLSIKLKNIKFDDSSIDQGLTGIKNALNINKQKKLLYRSRSLEQNNLAQKIVLSYKNDKFRYYLTISIIIFNLPLLIKIILLSVDKTFRENSLCEDISVANKI